LFLRDRIQRAGRIAGPSRWFIAASGGYGNIGLKGAASGAERAFKDMVKPRKPK